MRLFIALFIIFFDFVVMADESLQVSIIAKQDNQLVLITDKKAYDDTESLNQVPFNSLKDLKIKGLFNADNSTVLVFDLKQNSDEIVEKFVMTQKQQLIPVQMSPTADAVMVRLTTAGAVFTENSDLSKATLIGKIKSSGLPQADTVLLLKSSGELITENGETVGQMVADDQTTVKLVTDLENKIAILTGSGSEVVVFGEKPEFLASVAELQQVNLDKIPSDSWLPVVDLKISSLGSVLQIQFRNKGEDVDAFSSFKMISPLIVSQIKENKF